MERSRQESGCLKMLIVFYNRMWKQPIPRGRDVPPGCEFTEDRRRLSDADAVIFHIPSLRWLRPPAKRPGQLWVAWSLECEVNYPRLTDPSFMRMFDLTMSYRESSDARDGYICYYSSSDNLARKLRQPPQPKREDRVAVAFLSSRFNQSRRREYLRELMSILPVDSYGRFMRNRRLEDDRGRVTKMETIANYKFTLAFENAIGPDYVTEKFLDPLVAGSVPVYLGAPNVASLAPGNHCYIDAAGFESPRALASYLLEVAGDPTAYAAYLEWKTQPFNPSFERYLDLMSAPAIVRLVECIRARRPAPHPAH